MITPRRLVQGKAWEYLTDGVAKAASDPDQESALTRYYASTGCPPGRFRGAGLAALGLADGDVVTEEHLQRMLGDLADPVTGEPVGSAPKRAEQGKPVAGFDLTFSPWKSISVAWAMADQGTQALIYECHERAIRDTLAYAEEHYFRSRRGKNGVAFEEIEGVIATAFTHYDSRSHDPDLHDHVVLWNRVRGASDGKWRTLDSRGLHNSIQALSTLHSNILATYLTEALGWGWDQTETRKGMLKAEVTGVPERLMTEFSQRTKDIEALREKLLTQFREHYGREPNPVEFDNLNSAANQRTRASKEHKSLEELTDAWRERAGPYVGPEPASWVSTLAGRNDLPALRTGDISNEMLADVARVALRRTSDRRSVHTRAHVETQVSIELFGVRFASVDDLISVTRRATDMALDGSVQVSVGDLHHVPQQWKSRDGASKFRPVKERLFTTNALLEAEARLFGLAERHDTSLRASRATVAQVCDQPLPGRAHKPGLDQALAVELVATSGRVLDTIVGPAGTGKTTALAALRTVWEAEHGAGSVVGLAPSAAAAQVLADELGIPTENTAKWLYESDRELERRAELAELRARLTAPPTTHPGPLPARAERLAAEIQQWSFKAGQLVIVDEASLAGTFVLDRLAARAAEAGAKIVLVGDPEQLSSVDAGGMFRSLARRDGVAELTDIRRFQEAWEAKASTQIRVGREEAIDTYLENGRVVEGDRDTLLDQVYRAWRADTEGGEVSLMIAGDSATVAELNARARADRVAAGEVEAKGLALSGGGVAGAGDVVVTRENARLLSTGRGWVKNGDRWVVTATHKDGSMAVKRADGGGGVVLPADYVAEHVELGYATTAHRAQGRTVGTAHAIVGPTTTREVAYVAVTRGRKSNRLYVDTHWDPDPDSSHEGMIEPQTAKGVLASVLARTGVDVSATDTIRSEQETAESVNRLWAEYATIAARPQGEHWDALLESVLGPADFVAVKSSDAIGPLHMALAQAAAHGIDIEAKLPGLSRNLAGLHDVAAGLEARITRHTRLAVESGKTTSSGLIAGLLPRAVGIEDFDVARALSEREAAIEARADAKLAEALVRHERWTAGLGEPPASPVARFQWERSARTVAAYRDRWDGPAHRPLPQAEQCRTKEQLAEWARAKRALDACWRVSAAEQAEPAQERSAPGAGLGIGL
jgi:conjugative relaxase-like TrwC/TraI family protein